MLWELCKWWEVKHGCLVQPDPEGFYVTYLYNLYINTDQQMYDLGSDRDIKKHAVLQQLMFGHVEAPKVW